MVDKYFWQNKKVFLTGHTGFKGGWLSIWLKYLGAKVMGYSLPPNTAPSLFVAAGVESCVVESTLGNICDYEKLNAAMVGFEPDIVIHMAAQPLVRLSYKEPLATYQTNVIGTANVLEAMKNCSSIKAALVITTDKCYKNNEWLWGYRENEPLGGYDPYSASKACAEIVTESYRKSFLQEKGIPVATARAGNVIGGGDWASDRLVPDCLRAIEQGEVIKIRSPQAIRPWQHVLEPLAGYLMLLEKLYNEGDKWAEGWNFGPYDMNVSTVGSIVERICQRLNGCYEFSEDNQYHEAEILKLDSSKANWRLGWRPKLNLAETVEYIASWQQAWQNKAYMRSICEAQIKDYERKIVNDYIS